jgi:two-component system, LuxR family, sensor kinase FixL
MMGPGVWTDFKPFLPRTLIPPAALMIGYVGGVALGMALTFDPVPVSTLWPPNAIVLAALLLSPVRRWWLLLAVLFPVHMAAEYCLGVPLRMASLWYLSNVTEALLGAVLMLRILGRAPRFDRTRDVATFIAIAGILAPIVSSFVDVSFVWLADWRYTEFWYIWRTRTLSNSLAALIVAPLIVTCLHDGVGAFRRRPNTMHLLETSALLVGLCVASAFAFERSGSTEQSLLLANATLPFLMWAALRRGVSGLSLAVAIVAMFAILGLLSGRGPFTDDTPEAAVRAAQGFLFIIASSLMLLAASLAELREARAVAVRQAQSLDLALEAAQMGMWEWDMRRNWITRRDSSTETTRDGAPQLEGTMQDLLQHVHPEDQPLLTQAISDVSEQKGRGDVEFRLLRDDGTVRWIRTRGRVLCDASNNAIRMMGVYLETTHCRSQEAQLVAQHEQIARLNKVSLLAELSAALAHEVKQPLTAILSNAQAACRLLDAAKTDKGELGAILADIIAEDRRATEVMQRLRSLFVRGALQSQPVDARDCIHEVLAMQRGYLIAHGVTMVVRPGVQVPAAMVDRVQLQQVLINLISNACDSMTAVPPESRLLQISDVARDGHVEIEVCDSGPGIVDTEVIFRPFYTTKADGLGLGLAICRSIVAAHGGRLWATNNPTRGATLHVSLLAAGSQTASTHGMDFPDAELPEWHLERDTTNAQPATRWP